MGPLRVVWAVLPLLEALEGQAPQPRPAIAAPAFQSFQEDQFQGEWYVLGLAGNSYSKTDRSLLGPFTATFEENEEGQLQVSYAMTRGQRCVTWSYVLIPLAEPGKFSVDNRSETVGEPGVDTEEMWVYDTDYTTFALMVFKRRSGHYTILRIHLLCRTWAIQTRVLNAFVCLAKAHGLSEDNVVFPDLTEWSLRPGTC